MFKNFLAPPPIARIFPPEPLAQAKCHSALAQLSTFSNKISFLVKTFTFDKVLTKNSANIAIFRNLCF